MISIDEIKKPIKNEFLLFDKQFNKMFESNNDVLSAVNKYILQKNGKQIRPILTILAAKICGISNMSFYSIVKDILGESWLNNELLRFGASSLAGDIEKRLGK